MHSAGDPGTGVKQSGIEAEQPPAEADKPDGDAKPHAVVAKEIEADLLSEDPAKVEAAFGRCNVVYVPMYMAALRSIYKSPDRYLSATDVAAACNYALQVLADKVRDRTLQAYNGVGRLLWVVASRRAQRLWDKQHKIESRERPLPDFDFDGPWVVIKDPDDVPELLSAIKEIVHKELTPRERTIFLLVYGDVWRPSSADGDAPATSEVDHDGAPTQSDGEPAVLPKLSDADRKALRRGLDKIKEALHARGLTHE